MRAVILVGGEGTRLRPLTLTVPKQILPVVDVTMIERVLGGLAAYGVDEAVLSLGYRPDAFLRLFPDGSAAGVKLTYAVEPEPLDTAGAIRFAAEHAGIDERFVVVNGDVLCDLNLEELVRFHDARGALGTIALTPVDDPSAFGVVPTDPEGRVLEFVEKPPRASAPTNLINAGTYVLEPEVLERVALGRRTSIEREVFPALAATGRLFAMAGGDYWLDAGTPASYLQAHQDVLAGRYGKLTAHGEGARALSKGVWVVSGAVVTGEVRPASFIGRGCEVEAGARVSSSVLSRGSRVCSGAEVSASLLLPGAVVEAGAVVDSSIVGNGSVVHEGCSVLGLSVIGCDVSVAPGTYLDGARVPEGGGAPGSEAGAGAGTPLPARL